MSAPIYRDFLYTPELVKVGWIRWAWHVGDGYLRTLREGTAPTRWGARRARDRFAATCISAEEAAELELRTACAAAVERLHAEGLDVTFWLVGRRVCVRPCCEVTTAQEVRVLREFMALTANVIWKRVAR